MAFHSLGRWRRQPAGAVGIDWSHPLARDLVAFIVIEDGRPVDLVSGLYCSVGANYSASLYSAGAKEGVRYRNSNTGSGGVFFNLPWSNSTLITGEHSLFVFGTDSGSTTAAKAWIELGNGSSECLSLYCNNGSSYGVFGNVTGTTNGIARRTTGDLTGSNHKLVAVYAPGYDAPVVYLDGSTGGSTTSVLSGPSSDVLNRLSLSASLAGGGTLQGGLYVGAYWSRALTQDDVTMLQNDCLQHVRRAEVYPRFFIPSISTINTKSPPTVRKSRLLTTAPTGEKVRTSAPQAPALHLKKWSSQPSGPVGINWSHPLANRLKDAWIAPYPGAISARGVRTASTGGSIGRTAGADGIALLLTSEYQGITSGYTATDVFEGGSTATIFLLRRGRNASTSASSAFGYAESASNRVLLHAPFSDNAWYFDFGDSNGGSGRVSIAGIGRTTNLEAIVCVAGPSKGREIWKNGQKLVGNASATASRPASTQNFHIGGWAAGTATLSQDDNVFLFGVSLREWSDAEIRAWSEAPYQLFRRHTPRIYVGA